LLTKVTSAMKTRTQLNERSFEELLAAAYLLQQRREPIPFPARPEPALNEAERLAAIAEAQAKVHSGQLQLQEQLQLVAERAQRITGGAGAAIWLLRGSQVLCQLACGGLSASVGQRVSRVGSRLTGTLRDGAVLRCADAKSDPRMRYDALPSAAEGSLLAVPIHFEGRVQGALEVTFAQAWGFQDTDVRTCQILSGLVSEAVALAAGQEQMEFLHSERATLLDALDRLQPHLSKLLDSVDGSSADGSSTVASRIPGRIEGHFEEAEETPSAPMAFPPAPTGPTHGLARLGKYLLDQQEQGMAASKGLEHDSVTKPGSREVHTALNLSVSSHSVTGPSRAQSVPPAEQDFESYAFDIPELELEAQPYSEPYAQTHDESALETVRPSSSVLTPADEPWLHAAPESLAAEQPPAATPGFWRSHAADVCLAASAVILAASLTWALWPHPNQKKPAAQQAAAAEPKLSVFEELLVSMGLAEAPPAPAAYTGSPATRVWVDINSALYYCPGAEPYGKTPKGKFLTQREAQDEQFQPARGQPCD
jgi:hypothetical protein